MIKRKFQDSFNIYYFLENTSRETSKNKGKLKRGFGNYFNIRISFFYRG